MAVRGQQSVATSRGGTRGQVMAVNMRPGQASSTVSTSSLSKVKNGDPAIGSNAEINEIVAAAPLKGVSSRSNGRKGERESRIRGVQENLVSRVTARTNTTVARMLSRRASGAGGETRGISQSGTVSLTVDALEQDSHASLVAGPDSQVEVVGYPLLVTSTSPSSHIPMPAPVARSVYSFQSSTAFEPIFQGVSIPPQFQRQHKTQLDEHSRRLREQRHILQLAQLQEEERLRVEQLREEQERELTESQKREKEKRGSRKTPLTAKVRRPSTLKPGGSLNTATETASLGRLKPNARSKETQSGISAASPAFLQELETISHVSGSGVLMKSMNSRKPSESSATPKFPLEELEERKARIPEFRVQLAELEDSRAGLAELEELKATIAELEEPKPIFMTQRDLEVHELLAIDGQPSQSLVQYSQVLYELHSGLNHQSKPVNEPPMTSPPGTSCRISNVSYEQFELPSAPVQPLLGQLSHELPSPHSAQPSSTQPQVPIQRSQPGQTDLYKLPGYNRPSEQGTFRHNSGVSITSVEPAENHPPPPPYSGHRKPTLLRDPGAGTATTYRRDFQEMFGEANISESRPLPPKNPQSLYPEASVERIPQPIPQPVQSAGAEMIESAQLLLRYSPSHAQSQQTLGTSARAPEASPITNERLLPIANKPQVPPNPIAVSQYPLQFEVKDSYQTIDGTDTAAGSRTSTATPQWQQLYTPSQEQQQQQQLYEDIAKSPNAAQSQLQQRLQALSSSTRVASYQQYVQSLAGELEIQGVQPKHKTTAPVVVECGKTVPTSTVEALADSEQGEQGLNGEERVTMSATIGELHDAFEWGTWPLR